MFFRTVLVCLSVICNQVSTELILKKDATEKITFDGNELEFEVDNSGGIQGYFTLCIKSADQITSPGCPTGFDDIHFSFDGADVRTFKMNRQGKVMLDVVVITAIKAITFIEDEALEVILKEVPHQSTIVRLLNAVRYVPPEPVEATTLNKSGSMAVFSIVVIVLLAIAGLLIAGLIAAICYCRRRTQRKVEQSNDQSQKYKSQKPSKVDFAPTPPRAKSRRTSSTTVTTTLTVKPASSVAVLPVANTQSKSSMNTANPTLSPDTKPISSP